LEYDSVKVVITNEIEEMISHNIFYTAITRAKERLKIYWSPETEKRVLESMKEQFNDKDYRLFKEKFRLELNL
jgi:ATP-dependent exoDNAse (exonuclease V) alpha subunit